MTGVNSVTLSMLQKCSLEGRKYFAISNSVHNHRSLMGLPLKIDSKMTLMIFLCLYELKEDGGDQTDHNLKMNSHCRLSDLNVRGSDIRHLKGLIHTRCVMRCVPGQVNGRCDAAH